MTKTKLWLIIGTVLTVIGFVSFSVIMVAFDLGFTDISTVKYETNTHVINGAFENISVNTDTADIVFAPSEDGVCRVVCYESEKVKHIPDVSDGTLKISLCDERAWYEHISFTLDKSVITVYLPMSEYGAVFIKESTGDVKIPSDLRFSTIDITASTGDVTNYASASESISVKTNTGSITASGISAGKLVLSASTGDVKLTDAVCTDLTVNTTSGDVTVTDTVADTARVNTSTGDFSITNAKCKDLTSFASTGDITLTSVIVSDKLSLERETGDVRFDSSDAGEILIKTDTGDVVGTLLTAKIFIPSSSSGNIDVPKTVTGGRCEIVTDTGDIRISLK